MVRTCICCKANKFASDVSLYKFPQDSELLKKWLTAIRTEKRVCESSRICSRHFKEDDFRYSLIGGNRFLKQGAIPSLHLENESKEDQFSDDQDTVDGCIVGIDESRELIIMESQIEGTGNDDQLSHIMEEESEVPMENISDMQFALYECLDEPEVSKGKLSPASASLNEPKHKKHLYDVHWEEISTSPEQAKIYWEVAMGKIVRQKRMLKTLQQRVRRLKSRISELQDLVKNTSNDVS